MSLQLPVSQIHWLPVFTIFVSFFPSHQHFVRIDLCQVKEVSYKRPDVVCSCFSVILRKRHSMRMENWSMVARDWEERCFHCRGNSREVWGLMKHLCLDCMGGCLNQCRPENSQQWTAKYLYTCTDIQIHMYVHCLITWVYKIVRTQ